MTIHYYHRVLLCEQVAVKVMVSAGRGRRRREKTTFKWVCHPVWRIKNEEGYPSREIETRGLKVTVFNK